MRFQKSINRFFFERSFPLPLQLLVFTLTILVYIALILIYRSGSLSHTEGRMVLYLFYILIFADAFFCGFFPGIVLAVLSSVLAGLVLVPQGISFTQITLTQMEVFPFVAMFFMVAITVDWFRQNIENLQEQIHKNQQFYEQAKQMEKLALAGEIAAGIAHEIRNPLTVIQGYIQLITLKCQKRCNSEESFTLLLDELRRANTIISDFLLFSRPNKPKQQILQLNEIIDATASLLYSERIRTGVQLTLRLAPDLPTLSLDRDQILQVFLNLLTNAIQAMPEGGMLSIATTHNERHVTIKISDTGTGMPKETLQRIFSPFYTTKENGTGLGLAITQNIILAHSGSIQVTSTLQEGTTFVITLPTR